MNYKFTDLSKYQNYIGFESGIICKYPSLPNPTYLEREDKGCQGNEWYIDRYMDDDLFNKFLRNSSNVSTPLHYDPRCRPWYKEQYEDHNYPVFTEIYRFNSNNKLGITNCVPVKDQGNRIFYGAYCIDMYPSSEDKSFMKKYYQHVDIGPIDYLIFTEDKNFTSKDYMNSEFKNYLQEFIFDPVNLNVSQISIEGVDATQINQYIRKVNDPRIDMSRVNIMEDGQKLDVGEVEVIDDK